MKRSRAQYFEYLGCFASVLLLVGSVSAAELLVGSIGTSQVLRYNAKTGAFIDVFISGGGLNAPRGILLGSDGNVYVASYNTDNVKKYDGTTGAYIGDFVTTGSGGLDGPDGMCWGPDGNLYVASSINHKINRYQGPAGASPGALIDTFVSPGSGGLNTPRGIMFGNDQYTGGAPGAAQDGYPELFVCSFGTQQILRYSGKATATLAAGAFLDVYGQLPGGQFPNNFIYEHAFEDNWTFNELHRGNLLVLCSGGDLEIWSGTFADHEISYDTFFGNFFNGLAGNPRGISLGPDRGKGGAVGSYDNYQDFYVSKGTSNTVRVVGSDESDLGDLFAAGTGGISNAGYNMIKCGRNVPTLIRKVLNNSGLQGTMHTVTLQGDNLAALTSVKLLRMRQGNTLAYDGTTSVTATAMQMVGNDLQATFDLTGLEAGRYGIMPVDSCETAMWFPDAVLVYLAKLTNGGFEEGWKIDRENVSICVNPSEYGGGGGNKSRPKHWYFKKNGPQSQMGCYRDGNIHHPCDGTIAKGVTGLHYGSLASNVTDNTESIMFQTIAAPYVETPGWPTAADYKVYADIRIASMVQESWGYIRLIDGTDKSGVVIAETQISNTEGTDQHAIVRDPSFVAIVPEGYVYSSNPATLTIEFVLHSIPGDESNGLALKAMHVDAVRNRPTDCVRSPWADSDGDKDIDQVDFADFERCFTLVGAPVGNCACYDRTDDGKVDLNDFPFFAQCATGPGVVSAPSIPCD